MNQYPLSSLIPGMRLSKNVYSLEGKLLLKKDIYLTRTHIDYLKRFKIKSINIEPSEKELNAVAERNSNSTQHFNNEAFSAIEKAIQSFLQNETPNLIKTEHDRNIVNKIINPILFQTKNEKVIELLLKTRMFGDTSFYHYLKIAVLSVAIGIKMNFDRGTLNKLILSALLFDIGKWHLDKSILLKEGRLTRDEYESVKEHTIIGYMMLLENFDEEIALVALQHHERYDGSGYPKGKMNDEIHIFSRIISVADVYCSLIVDRPYRKKYLPNEAIEFILGSGGLLFDPDIVKYFTDIISIYPIGSIVELNNGALGIVHKLDDNPIGRPIIKLLYDENKEQPNEQKLIDLSQSLSITIKRYIEI